MRSESRHGFTLIELLLSVALISIIAGISLPVTLQSYERTDLAIATSDLVSELARARSYAHYSRGDSAWGVYVENGSIILFRGQDYASRDASYDTVTSMPESIELSGLTETVFSKMNGQPNTTGTITLRSANGVERTITIHEEGSVSHD